MSDLDALGEEVPGDDDLFDMATFSSGVKKRVTLLLVLDTSSSMAPEAQSGPRPIDELNEALKTWATSLQSDRQLRHRAEIGIVTFGKGGVTLQKLHDDETFVPAALFKPPKLEASGVTPMLDAIHRAVGVVEERKRWLDSQGIMRFRPLIFMLTDGAPTDESGTLLTEADWRPLADEIAALERRKKLAFFAVGVRGANIAALKSLAPEGYWNLSRGDLMEFLRLVSASAGDDDPLAYAREHLMRLHAQAT